MLCVFYFCPVFQLYDDYNNKLCNTTMDQGNGLWGFWLQKIMMLVLLWWTLLCISSWKATLDLPLLSLETMFMSCTSERTNERPSDSHGEAKQKLQTATLLKSCLRKWSCYLDKDGNLAEGFWGPADVSFNREQSDISHSFISCQTFFTLICLETLGSKKWATKEGFKQVKTAYKLMPQL